MVDTSKIKKVKIDKDKVKKNQDTLMSWFSSLFEGKNKNKKNVNPRGRSAAKKIIESEVKTNPSITEIKKKVNAAIKPTKNLGGRDFEKPIKPKEKNKTKPKDIGDAEDSIRKNRKKRKAADDGTVSPRLVGALSRNAKPSQVSAGPGEISNRDDPVRKEKERSRREKGKNVIDKSAGSKKEGIGKQLARALSGGQKKTKVGNVTIDSTDEGMSKFLGTKDEIRQQMEDEEMNFRKGGAVKKKYGMREGGFTKRGGMYKKGY